MYLELLKALLASLFIFVGFGFGFIAWRILTSDTHEYERNRRLSGGLKALFGFTPTRNDGIRDFRISAGLVFDKQKNEFVENGKLSDESVDIILKRSW